MRNVMLVVLDIRAKNVCDRSGVSESRLSLFRSGKKANMGTNFLDALPELERYLPHT